MSKRKVLILGKLPPPYMGPAIATGIILNSDLKNRFILSFLNTKANDSISTLGKWNFQKVFRNVSIYFKMLAKMIKHRPDVVLIPISQTTTGFVKDSLFIWIARAFGGKVVVQLRGSNFKNWINQASPKAKRYVSRMLQKTQGVIVLGNNLRYLFEDYYPAERIFVVPNGANYQIPNRQASNREEFKILYLSNLLSSKGIEDVFEAIAILKETHAGFSVDFIGEWLHENTKQYCLKLAEEKQLPVRIHSSEASRNKFQYLSNADVFVFPPREPEGHPWSIVEAMAAGLPVISTDQGAIVESVIDGVNGYVVEPKHPDQIANKLRLLIDNKNLREKMAQAARNLYLQNFTEEKMVDRFSDVFNQTIDRPSAWKRH